MSSRNSLPDIEDPNHPDHHHHYHPMAYLCIQYHLLDGIYAGFPWDGMRNAIGTVFNVLESPIIMSALSYIQQYTSS